jgi:SSS family solute:Na+ symporter
MQILPPGLRGFFLAGILATILSTLDSFLFVAANTVSYDLAPKRFRNSVRFNHVCTFAVAIFTVFLSSIFDGSIEDAWKTIGSYSAGCLLLPMLIGLFRPGTIGEISFIMGTGFGVIGITYWRLTEHVGFFAAVDDFYIGILATACGIVLGKWIEIKRYKASIICKPL